MSNINLKNNNNSNSENKNHFNDIEESSASLKKLQEVSQRNRALQKKSQNSGNNEEEDEEDEEEEDEEDEEDEGGDESLDDEQKSNLIGFFKNLLTKVGIKSLFATGASIGGIGAIATLFVGMYRVHYNGEFEFKGIGGEYQSFSFKNMNFTSFDKSGDVELSGLTKENKLTKTYYTMYSDNSYYAIVEDSNKYTDINDAYKRKNLLTPDELRKQYPDIKDVEGREKMFQLNPDVLYSLDRYLHKNQFLYPQQFIKPVYYEENQKDFSLKQLTDSNNKLAVKSQLFNEKGNPLTDSNGKLKKEDGVWDYGLASILRYKEYEIKEREVSSMSGSKLKYKGYINQNDATDNSTENKEVSQTTVDKVDASYIAPGIDSGGTSAEKNTGKYAYAIDTAVTAGGTIDSKVAQKWQEKEGTRKTITKTYQFTETATKEVFIEGEQKTETQTIVYNYEIEYTYEVYTEEYLPYYEGDLDTSGITGSKYYRDYIKNYSNYIPVDVPNQLDLTVFDNNDEVSSLLVDDTPGMYSSQDDNSSSSQDSTQQLGTTFKAEFTAYKSGDGGYNVDASGNKLDYTKNTCAGPVKSLYSNSKLTLGSKIVIQGTGTEKDGMTCTVTDTGVPLDSDGTYHIDILVKDEATARKFGRRKGTIKIINSDSTSSTTNTTTSNTTTSNTTSSNTTTSGSGNSLSLPKPRDGEERSLTDVLKFGKEKESQKALGGLNWMEYAKKYGKIYGVDPYIICAIISSESGGNKNAKNQYGFCGLMQLSNKEASKNTKVTAYNHETKTYDTEILNSSKYFDPDYNIKLGTMKLAQNFKESNGNVLLSMQGYNNGIYGAKFILLYYLSGGTLSGMPPSMALTKGQTELFNAYSAMNHPGWVTALYDGDLTEESADNGPSYYDLSDNKHDACTWYASKKAGQSYYLMETSQYYAGDAMPWMMKEDGTVVTVDGGVASGYTAGSSSANSAFNSYLASNWEKVLELKEDLFPWSIDLDKKLKEEFKGNYSDLKNTKLAIRNKTKFISNLTNTDVDIAINMMFALNQGNYLSKYDYMGEAEWKAMYNQLLSSPTGKTWDDKWIGFTCEEVFGKSLEDLGTLFKEGSGVNPTISKPYGVLMNSISNDTAVLSQYNDMNFGIDMSLPKDTEILALDKGEILSINKKSSPLSRYGIYVKIKYNANTIMIVSNLKELDKSIKVGSTIKKGDVLGISGGNCKSYNENDLHIELLYKGNYINPEWILTRDMTGFDDPIKGSTGGVICGDSAISGVGVAYVDTALQQVGKDYVYGSQGPNTFDCSGLVLYSMKQNGIDFKLTGGYGYISANMRASTQRIKYEDLQVGDLIFRHGNSRTDYSADPNKDDNVRHVMIYIGNGEVVHASSPKVGVIKEKFEPKPNHSYGRYSEANNGASSDSGTSSSSACQTPTGNMTGDGTYVWPVPGNTRISSPYGWRICPYHGKEFHSGVDIPASSGVDVQAVSSGTVITATYHNSLGNYIEIDHGNGIVSRYAHNSKLLVSKGDSVKQGQVISKIGSTGTSTGPHLHFEIRINGKHTAPLDYIKP